MKHDERTAQVENIKQESKLVTKQSGSIERGGKYAIIAAGGVDYIQNPNIATGSGSIGNNCEEKSQKTVNDKHSESGHKATTNENAAKDKDAFDRISG